MTGDIIIRILSDPIAILMVVLFFGASIFVHEFGHYLAARWRGLKIERFSIGFGPRLFGWQDKQGVDWRVSLIPLGGYVALPQLADMRGIEGESDKDSNQLPALSYADKMYVSVAGAVFNVIFALAIASILWATGIPVPEQEESTKIGYIAESVLDEDGNQREAPAARAGLRPGDVILKVDNDKVEDFEDIIYAVTTGSKRGENGGPKTEFTIRRDNEVKTVDVYPVLGEHEGIRRVGISPASNIIVGSTMENSPAERVGLKPGDKILRVNGKPVYHTLAVSNIIQDNPDKPLSLTIERDQNLREVGILAEDVVINKSGDTQPMLGIRWDREVINKHINPIRQIDNAVSITLMVLGALIHPQSDIGINNLSGPVGISYTLYVLSQIGIIEVLSIVVLININLAILNLLPIPVLDGGHMVFATFAKLRGRPVSANVIASLQGAFMLFFLGIFVYVTFFDVGRVERNESAIMEAERTREQSVPIEFEGVPQPDSSNPEISQNQ